MPSAAIQLTSVGTFTIASSSYIIVITGRKQVAQIWGKPIYVITGVTLIPLSSFSEARDAIENTRKALESGDGNHAGAAADSDTTDDEAEHVDHVAAADIHEDPKIPMKEKTSALPASNEDQSIAKDVISKRGAYGRFAERWFSKKGWNVERRKSQGLSTNVSEVQNTGQLERSGLETKESSISKEDLTSSDSSTAQGSQESGIIATLIPKLLRTARLLLNSQSFYFSYDHDITHRVGSGPSRDEDIPLHRKADPMVILLSSFDVSSALTELEVLLESAFDIKFCGSRS